MGAVCCSQSSLDLDGEGMQTIQGKGPYGKGRIVKCGW